MSEYSRPTRPSATTIVPARTLKPLDRTVLRFLLAKWEPVLREALAGLSGTTITADVVTLMNIVDFVL